MKFFELVKISFEIYSPPVPEYHWEPTWYHDYPLPRIHFGRGPLHMPPFNTSPPSFSTLRVIDFVILPAVMIKRLPEIVIGQRPREFILRAPVDKEKFWKEYLDRQDSQARELFWNRYAMHEALKEIFSLRVSQMEAAQQKQNNPFPFFSSLGSVSHYSYLVKVAKPSV